MNFIVNDKIFNLNINNNKSYDCVKSYKHTYNVYYNNLNLRDLIKNNYSINDFIIIDKNVYNLDKSCFNFINSNYIFCLDCIEKNKTIECVISILDCLIELKLSKYNKILIIGGGITQDIGGTVCGLFKRGINWWFFPTTLLSMVDSAIGSKTSLNRKNKNILGLFNPPNSIYISNFFLKSLHKNEIISGLGESLKLSLIGGQYTFELFINLYKNNNFLDIIYLSNSIKKVIIEFDEFDTNERKVLNYGHTFGHAIEISTDYKIPHGISVLYGMLIINKLFYEEKYYFLNKFIIDLIPTNYFHLELNYNIFKNTILNDKKNKDNLVCFILLEEYGKTKFIFEDFKNKEIKLNKILRLFFNF